MSSAADNKGSDWPLLSFKEIASFLNGRAYAADEFKESGTPIVRIQNLTGEGNTVYSNLDLPENKYIENGDLIYAWSATFGPYIWKGPKSIYHYHIWKIICDEDRLDKYFFYYYLLLTSDNLKESGNGTLFVHITKSLMESFELNLPPYNDQKAIASVLTSLDDKIDLLHRQNKTIENIAETLFRQWFVAEAQEDWEEGTLENVATNIRNSIKVDQINDESKYIGLEHIDRRNIALKQSGLGGDVSSNKYAFSKNDILFGKLRPYFHKVCFAPFSGICSTDILVVRPKKPEWFAFCLFAFFQNDVVEYANLGSGGTRMPRTDWDALKMYPIAIPDLDTLKQFNNIVLPSLDKITYNLEQIRTLEKLRDTLLPKLMSGEVRVAV